MRVWLSCLAVVGCASRAPAPPPGPLGDPAHPFAAPGVSDHIRAAAAQVDAGDYAGAETALRLLLPDHEALAWAAVEQAVLALGEGDLDTAAEKLRGVLVDHPGTEATAAASRLLGELSVVGRDAGALEPVTWMQGESLDWATGTTLVVFFEAWCPHCRREMPAMQEAFEQLAPEGLSVLGLTRMSRDTSADDLDAFLDVTGATFPIAREDGDVTDRFGVDGVPAAAVVRDGTIVWRAHPMFLGPDVLRDLMAPTEP